MPKIRPLIAWIGCVAGLAGCGKEKAPEPPIAAETVRSAPPVPATIGLGDFKHLAYLHGDWRGAMANGQFFYERYAVVDDSTIRSYDISDSTFAPPSDSSAIRWSNGQVRSGSDRSSYVATVWSVDSVRFEPERGASNAFVWIRRSPDAWEARLEPPGARPPIFYEMRRHLR
jgi:hypothetical protein